MLVGFFFIGNCKMSKMIRSYENILFGRCNPERKESGVDLRFLY
jgi:hypothetical protein